mmetsp:Transcript_53206/g.161583  ORF Transcript_53206/g.161583 Transcript_53206/m.161583 type:complete len:489 (-) Transcript_53206:1635-3101(-)
MLRPRSTEPWLYSRMAVFDTTSGCFALGSAAKHFGKVLRPPSKSPCWYKKDKKASHTVWECGNFLHVVSYTLVATCGFLFRSWIRANCKYTSFASLWLAARFTTTSADSSVPNVHSKFMNATHALKRSCASEKPTCLMARSATCRAFSKSLVFKWKAMYRIHTIELSPSVSNNRSKSSTLRGSLAALPSAISASRCRSASACCAFAAFFWRFEGLLAPPSVSTPSSSCTSSSESLGMLARKSANTKAASPRPAPAPEAAATAAFSHGASSSESATAAASAAFATRGRFSPRPAGGAAGVAAGASVLAAGAAPSPSFSSSSAASSSSSSSSASPSNSDGLRPNHSFGPSIFSTFARRTWSPFLNESSVTEAVSDTSEMCAKPSSCELSTRMKTPYFSTALTRPLTTSPTESCSMVRPWFAPPARKDNSTRFPSSSTSATVASRIKLPGGCNLATLSLATTRSLKAFNRIRATRDRLRATNTPLSLAFTT